MPVKIYCSICRYQVEENGDAITCLSCCQDVNPDVAVDDDAIGDCNICGMHAPGTRSNYLPVCIQCSWAAHTDWSKVPLHLLKDISLPRSSMFFGGLLFPMRAGEDAQKIVQSGVASQDYRVVMSSCPLSSPLSRMRVNWAQSIYHVRAFLSNSYTPIIVSSAVDNLSYTHTIVMHPLRMELAMMPLFPTTVLAAIKLLFHENPNQVSDLLYWHMHGVKNLRFSLIHQEASLLVPFPGELPVFSDPRMADMQRAYEEDFPALQ